MAILAMWLQNPDYPARWDRQVVKTAFGGREQITEGLLVTQNGGGNLSVNVSAGAAVITGDNQTDQGSYVVLVDVLTNLAMPAAPGTNQRLDLVCLQVNDLQAGGGASDNATLVVVQGVASATPVAPATPASAIVLATVRRTAGDASVLTAHIIDSNLALRGSWPYTLSTASVPTVMPPNHLYVKLA